MPTVKEMKRLVGRHVIVTTVVCGSVRAYGSGREMVLKGVTKDHVTLVSKYKKPYVIPRKHVTKVIGFADERSDGSGSASDG